jgi:hypothetical protein
MSWGTYYAEASEYDNGIVRVTNYDDIWYYLKTDTEKDEFKKILTDNQKLGLETGNTIYLDRNQYSLWMY